MVRVGSSRPGNFFSVLEGKPKQRVMGVGARRPVIDFLKRFLDCTARTLWTMRKLIFHNFKITTAISKHRETSMASLSSGAYV